MRVSTARQPNPRAGRHIPYPATPAQHSPQPGWRTPHSGTSIDSGKSSRRPSTSSSDSGEHRLGGGVVFLSPSPEHNQPNHAHYQTTANRQHASTSTHGSPGHKGSGSGHGPTPAQRHLQSYSMNSHPLKIESPPRPYSSSSSGGNSPAHHNVGRNKWKGKEKAPPSPPRHSTSSSSSSSVSPPRTPKRFVSGEGSSSGRHH